MTTPALPAGLPPGTEVVVATGAPWYVWQFMEYQPNGNKKALHGLHGENTSAVACRVKVVVGRGTDLREYSQILQPGEVAQVMLSPALDLRSVQDYSVGAEQV